MGNHTEPTAMGEAFKKMIEKKRLEEQSHESSKEESSMAKAFKKMIEKKKL